MTSSRYACRTSSAERTFHGYLQAADAAIGNEQNAAVLQDFARTFFSKR